MITEAKSSPKAFGVWFKELHRWSVGSFRISKWGWPRDQIKKLSFAFERVVEPIDKTEFSLLPEHFVTVKFSGAIHSRQLHGKSDFKGRLFQARAGDIIYSKIDVRNGAIAVIPPHFPIVAVTSEFPVYRIRENAAIPEYIQLLFRTRHFLQIINSMVSGTSGRKRVQPAELESVEVPLPDIAKQKAIVAKLGLLQNRVNEARDRVGKIESQIHRSLCTRLDLRTPESRRHDKAFGVWWTDLARWGVSFNQQAVDGWNDKETRYPIVSLREVIKDLENGWSPRCLNRPAEEGEWGVLKLGAVSFGWFNDRENKALPSSLMPIPDLEVKKGEVLISRANIPRLVGACAIIEKTRPRLMLCDKIFRVVFKEQGRLEGAYLAEVMKLPQVRRQIEALCTGTSPTMQNITKPSLLSLRFPLPPVSVQLKLLTEVAASRFLLARERLLIARLEAELEETRESEIVLNSGKA